MRFNENYRLSYEMDEIYIQKNGAEGWQDLAPISETAAMAWEGLERGLSREALTEAIVNEFAGSRAAQVAADLERLIAQLKALGILEE